MFFCLGNDTKALEIPWKPINGTTLVRTLASAIIGSLPPHSHRSALALRDAMEKNDLGDAVLLIWTKIC
jgi:hypothetical protein